MDHHEAEHTRKKLQNIPTGMFYRMTHTKEGSTTSCYDRFYESSESIGKVETFLLYPGIKLSFLYFLADQTVCRHQSDRGILEINYCRFGRSGWNMNHAGTLYLGAGDCSIHTRNLCANSVMTFPNGYYEGLSIQIDLCQFSEHPPELIQEAGITGAQICRKFCANGSFSVLPGCEKTASIFSGFYDLPTSLQIPYCKLKLQELILYLYKIDYQLTKEPNRYQAEQIHIIKQVHDLLTENLEQRITIETLAKQFLMNPSTLKATFKAVYGNSIAAHIKEHRMEKASVLLRETDKSVAQISREVGYESQSKFSTEFRKVFHMLPSEYRKTHHEVISPL